MTNVLYFEAAGWDYEQDNVNESDVLCHRIRTSFYNNDGDQIFLDIGNTYMRDIKGKSTGKMGIWVDFCFKVPTDKNEEIKYNEIFSRTKEHLKLAKMGYTKENITNWINDYLNCSFDTIEVLDSHYGYNVHGDNGIYNLMEDIELNHKRAIARKEAYKNVDHEYRTLLNEKYSVINLLEMDAESITIKCHASDKALGNMERIKRILVNY